MRQGRSQRNLSIARRFYKFLLIFASVAFPLLPGFTLEGRSATRTRYFSAMAHQQSSDSSADRSSPGQQLAKESREAAGEDDQFKHSPSVQFVAKLTGLDLENAYWVCVLLNFVVIAAAIFWLSKKNPEGDGRGAKSQ
jgi:hypothetical protein